MDLKKLLKLSDLKKSNQSVIPFFQNGQYYIRFYFENNSKFLQVRAKNLLSALKDNKHDFTKPLGNHNKHFVFISINTKKIIFFISKEKELEKNSQTYEFDLKKFNVQDLVLLCEYYETLNTINKDISIFQSPENILA